MIDAALLLRARGMPEKGNRVGDQSTVKSGWRNIAAKSAVASLLRLPAMRALCIQVLALAVAVVAQLLLAMSGIGTISILTLVLLQAGSAALLTLLARMDRWWMPIQATFFPALYAAANLHLAAGIYLVAFLLFLFLYWGSYRTQVPFYPSGRAARAAVMALLPAEPGLRVVDIGSGFGGMVFHLARNRPDCCILGVELAPLPCYISKLIALLKQSKGRILRRDYLSLNLADYDVVFAYLSPAAMPALWSKAKSEMRPGTLLLSYEFAISDVESQFTNISQEDARILYGWRM
ncbi:MAG TPA: class I SAM-dependent methyltransferase [Burkholderiaceae bacterium]